MPTFLAHSTYSTNYVPGSTGSFVDVDFSTAFGADAGSVAGVLLRVDHAGTFAVRKNGSTDDFSGGTQNVQTTGSVHYVPCGVDSSDILEINTGSTSTVVNLVAYWLTSEATFNTNEVDIKLASAPTSITDVDLSTETGSAGRVAFIHCAMSQFNEYEYRFRVNGSTDDHEDSMLRRSSNWVTVGLDASYIFEMSVSTATNYASFTMGLVGYFTGANATINTNSTQASGNTTTAWTDSSAVSGADADTVGISGHGEATNGQTFAKGVRPNGESNALEDGGDSYSNLSHFTVLLDGSQLYEYYIADNRYDWHEDILWEEAGGGPVEVALTGSQPASTGSLSAQQTLAIDLAGSQPASTGAIAAQQTLAISLSGSQPASTGSLSAVQTLLVSLSGDQPASTGAISAQALIAVSLTGDQPASAGAISSVSLLLVSLTGDQPSSTGAISAQSIVAIDLAGSQPASTGALSVLQTGKILSGNQPAGPGALSVQQTLLVALAGSQPQSTGALTLLQTVVVLSGNQPQSTGSLIVLQFISLAGNQPASTGALSAESVTGSTRVITLIGMWSPTITVGPGMWSPTITLTGRSDSTITLTGQS